MLEKSNVLHFGHHLEQHKSADQILTTINVCYVAVVC